jgi:hypothetical protein
VKDIVEKVDDRFIIHQTMFIQTTSQLPSVQNDVLTGQYAGLLCIIAWSIPQFHLLFCLSFFAKKTIVRVFKIVYNVCILVYIFSFYTYVYSI